MKLHFLSRPFYPLTMIAINHEDTNSEKPASALASNKPHHCRGKSAFISIDLHFLRSKTYFCKLGLTAKVHVLLIRVNLSLLNW